jgi:long-chain acyl-CoA synthetase
MMINSPDIEKYDLTSLKICVSGGASLPVEVLKAFKEKSGVSIAEGYGLSEVTVMTHCCPVDGLQKAGSIGPVLPGLESKVFNEQDDEVPSEEVGELVVKGPSIMKGYYEKPEETEVAMRNGWFHTGDLVIEDNDKYVFVVDRIKDMYIRGGKNVYPREIEEVLYAHPKVNEAAVIGIPDDRYGEEGMAYIVLKERMDATEDEFMEYLREKIARFKLPKHINFLDQLPKNSVGKILKRELNATIT